MGIQFIYMEKAQVIYRLRDDTVELKRPGALLRWFELENDNAGKVILHKHFKFKTLILGF